MKFVLIIHEKEHFVKLAPPSPDASSTELCQYKWEESYRRQSKIVPLRHMGERVLYAY